VEDDFSAPAVACAAETEPHDQSSNVRATMILIFLELARSLDPFMLSFLCSSATKVFVYHFSSSDKDRLERKVQDGYRHFLHMSA
jgi:hypothetical protein